MNTQPAITQDLITQAHQLYCQLTGQTVRLGFGRERQWFELLRVGFTLTDLRRVITYLQREIREGRRNVGALKLSNLLQPDRFEEDLNILRIQLKPSTASHPTAPPPPPPLPEDEKRRRQQQCLAMLAQLKRSLR